MWKKVVPERPETSDDLTKHMWVNWNVNTTLFDAEHHSATGRDKLNLNFDPFDSVDHFPFPTEPKEPEILYDQFAPFFVAAAKSIKFLKGKFKVEVLYGNYANIVEKIQFGLYNISKSGSTRPEEFPHLYDRVHLSNVPFVFPNIYHLCHC